MSWLTSGDRVLASIEIAGSYLARARGLIGRDGIDGALLIKPAKGIHTLGMRFPLDVAFCDKNMVVIATVRMERYRVGRFRLRARCVIEAEAGAFERWGLVVGDRLEIRD